MYIQKKFKNYSVTCFEVFVPTAHEQVDTMLSQHGLSFMVIGSLSSISDTNTDTNNKSCEVRAILVVVEIERQTYINPVFYSF